MIFCVQACARLRVSAQLIDAVTGAHRWAGRYDRELKDIFAVQDEVSGAIVAILVAQVDKAEAERTLLKPPATWQAHDFFMRASDVWSAVRSSYKVADLYEARQLFERSISLDPNTLVPTPCFRTLTCLLGSIGWMKII
jgi:adenylate cyclase